MVEIFRTNVNNKRLAKSVLQALCACFPAYRLNFDLDDCDRILRVQSDGAPIEIATILKIVEAHSIQVSLFRD